jgi:hypothetical protein
VLFYSHFRNQDELERWAVASKQKEDDSIVLQKYTRADEAKIKELNFSIEQLTREKLKCEVKERNIFNILIRMNFNYNIGY